MINLRSLKCAPNCLRFRHYIGRNINIYKYPPLPYVLYNLRNSKDIQQNLGTEICHDENYNLNIM